MDTFSEIVSRNEGAIIEGLLSLIGVIMAAFITRKIQKNVNLSNAKNQEKQAELEARRENSGNIILVPKRFNSSDPEILNAGNCPEEFRPVFEVSKLEIKLVSVYVRLKEDKRYAILEISVGDRGFFEIAKKVESTTKYTLPRITNSTIVVKVWHSKKDPSFGSFILFGNLNDSANNSYQINIKQVSGLLEKNHIILDIQKNLAVQENINRTVNFTRPSIYRKNTPQDDLYFHY